MDVSNRARFADSKDLRSQPLPSRHAECVFLAPNFVSPPAAVFFCFSVTGLEYRTVSLEEKVLLEA